MKSSAALSAKARNIFILLDAAAITNVNYLLTLTRMSASAGHVTGEPKTYAALSGVGVT
jgi:hypothetical protein